MKLKIAKEDLIAWGFTILMITACVVIGIIMSSHDEVADFSKPEIWVDPETRVQYLIIDENDKAALTVRVNEDGTPFTGGNEE